MVAFPAVEHHRPLAGTKLYCFVTEAHVCEQLANSHLYDSGTAGSRDHKSKALTITLPCHVLLSRVEYGLTSYQTHYRSYRGRLYGSGDPWYSRV